MRAAKTVRFPIYSSSYLVSFDGGELLVKRRGLLWRLVRYLFGTPGRIWRFFNLKIILILILALICGYYLGWDEGFSVGIDLEYEEKVDWLLHEAKI